MELTPYHKYELEYWRGKGLKLGIEGNKKRLRKYLDKINEAQRLPESCETAMDVGCGPYGGISLIYPAKRWILIDDLNYIYKNMAKRNLDFEYLDCSGENISTEDEIVDIVFCTNALDHTMDRRQALREIYRVLRPGGIFALCVHCRTFEELNEGHQQSFTPSELESEIYAIGFTKCDYITYVFGYKTFAGVIVK